MNRVQKDSGFTLMEMIAVVSIVGVLAAIAIPRLTMHLERTRSAEAVQILEALYKSQRAYFYENNAYTSTLADLDIDIPPSSYFNTPIVATTDPIASITRNTNSYTLNINSNGTISCTPAGTTCTKLGF